MLAMILLSSLQHTNSWSQNIISRPQSLWCIWWNHVLFLHSDLLRVIGTVQNWLNIKENAIFSSLTVAMSMEAVASSMIRMLLLRTNARAKQNSCRCPWLKFSPPSVTMASKMKQKSTRAGLGFIPAVRSAHYSNDFLFKLRGNLKLLKNLQL